MNSTLQRAVTSFYNLVYEAQTFATTMARIDTAEQEHYAGRIEGLNWVLDRCQELEDMDTVSRLEPGRVRFEETHEVEAPAERAAGIGRRRVERGEPDLRSLGKVALERREGRNHGRGHPRLGDHGCSRNCGRHRRIGRT